MPLYLLLAAVASWDETTFANEILRPAQRILELPGELIVTEVKNETDESGALLQSVTGEINHTKVFIQFWEFTDGRLELNWVEGLEHGDWHYMPPSRSERLFATGLLGDEIAPMAIEPIRVVSNRGTRSDGGPLLQMALLNEIGGKHVIHRVDYKHDGRDAVKLVAIVDVLE
jgi:hypothetical protein